MKAASFPSGFHSEMKRKTTGEFMLDIKELKIYHLTLNVR